MDKKDMKKSPIYITQKLIQGRWAILILHNLENGPVRFNELQRRMPKMNHATLSSQLKQLAEGGLVKRTVLSNMPPVVEYSLTDIGSRFRPVLHSIQNFGTEYLEYKTKETGDDQTP